jgi:signal transduction histidine kinase
MNEHAAGTGGEAAAGSAAYGTAPSAHILIVDDNAMNLMALQELLVGPGRVLVPASSGDAAVREVRRRDFAVILLDVYMPGQDGFETARLIRQYERSRHTPIIFLTGAFDDSVSMFRGYEAGAVDYIVKPVVPEVLKSKVAVFLAMYNNSMELKREIAERREAEQRVKQSRESLRALTARLQSVREEEQTRIAREIHDELGQALTGLKMDLAWLSQHLSPTAKELAQKTAAMSGLIDNTIHAVRRIASGLRPEVLDEAGLGTAIEWQVREFQKRTGIRCRITLPEEEPELERDQATAVFRILQEVLTNVARHAHATRVDVVMTLDARELQLEVQDNGRGIGESERRSSKSLGLLGMRERALLIGGEIDIAGLKGAGTRVMLSVPLGGRGGKTELPLPGAPDSAH